MKVVFLDIDGVLNSDLWNAIHQTDIYNGRLIDEDKVKLLSMIIINTGAMIVLHSGWRFWLNKNLQPIRKEADYLLSILNKYKINLYDITPDLSTEEIKKSKKFSLIKAKEIMMWLGEHKEVNAYVVLDDLDLHNVEISQYQIRTDSKVGLTEIDVRQAIRMLLEC